MTGGQAERHRLGDVQRARKVYRQGIKLAGSTLDGL